MATFSREQIERVVELDPEQSARRKAQRERRYHVWDLPILQVIGTALVLGLAALHSVYVVPLENWTHFWIMTGVVSAYALVSWGILYR